ncbi:hypothetical protein BC831DRAFT_451156 [Entophlyctis helioformis]|nr:hypothetical protein BC831DRAFT_451156 [Entophlyctis helioformis]
MLSGLKTKNLNTRAFFLCMCSSVLELLPACLLPACLVLPAPARFINFCHDMPCLPMPSSALPCHGIPPAAHTLSRTH